MPYEQFLQDIEKRLKSKLGEGRNVYLRTTLKNNGKQKKGITFLEEGVKDSPTIYMEEYYEQFLQNGNMESIVSQILSLYQKVRRRHARDGEFLWNYDNVKDRIIYRVVNRAANKKMLQGIPFTPYLDLAITYYVLVDIKRPEEEMAVMLIRKEHLVYWEVSGQEVHERAQVNTPTLLPYDFTTMCAAIEELLNGEEETEDDQQQEEDLYVLTNIYRSFGAAAMLYDGRLSVICTYLKENFYVLPSSIHEVIIVPESRAPSHEELNAIVKDINETQVLSDELLSDNAYYFDLESKELMRYGLERSIRER